MTTLLSSLCQSTEDVRRAIRSMPDVVTMIVDFWTAIVDADLCCLGIESDSRMPELVLLTLRVSVTLPMAACVESESRTESVPLPLITRAAGGVERVVITALKYIRMITRGMPRINPREALSRYAPGHYTANSVCFSHCVRFLLSASQFDPVLREAWISRGSIQIVTMAIKRLSRRILTKHGDGLADDPDSGLEYRRSLLEGGYIYLKFALQSVDDGVTVACQSLQSGLLETILQFGSSDSANSNRFRRVHNADLALLGDITRYFVYERVLIILSKSLEKIVSQNIESHARQDASLYAAWMDVKETAFRNLRMKASVAKDVHPLYAPGCAFPDCSAHGTMGGDVVLWRCSGCLVSAYCSKACQRSHWDEEHRTVCNIARHGLGTQGSRDLRRSIPIISLIETMQGLSDGGRIDALVAEAQHKTPGDRDRLVVELDMTMVPPEFKVRRFDDYLELFVPDFWKEIEGTMRMSQQATGKYLAVVVKVPDGNRAHTLWSPKTALAWGFGWGPGGDSHWLQTRKFVSSLPG
ncbi:hypothetical protein BV22DRAFT_565942 [Leucogyrophana mollusca]|uniref:Uncharacterized protein n=1 Tax=Leucogyrophana mollusca TaxID=85980 RepID=A0ACB8BF10_9AGAM|nr:hypothetical protein BV22DRAFT_565942 [Leucogyrophana mollusca]